MPSPSSGILRHLFRSPVAWMSAGLVLVVAGAKLGLIARYGSDVPFYDQWSAEGDTIFRWFSGVKWTPLVGQEGREIKI